MPDTYRHKNWIHNQSTSASALHWALVPAASGKRNSLNSYYRISWGEEVSSWLFLIYCSPSGDLGCVLLFETALSSYFSFLNLAELHISNNTPSQWVPHTSFQSLLKYSQFLMCQFMIWQTAAVPTYVIYLETGKQNLDLDLELSNIWSCCFT